MCPMKTPPRASLPSGQIGDDGLVIHADDGHFYVIPQDEYMNDAHRLDDPELLGEAKMLVDHGAIIADVNPNIPIGAYCYLINLASLKPRATPTQRAPATAKAPEGDAEAPEGDAKPPADPGA